MFAHDIIVKPVITEKSMEMMGENKFTFIVHRSANKVQIRKAVEEIFKINVVSVNTMNMRGKSRRVGVHVGRRSDWKKAIVKIADGQRIDFFEGM